jgi:hypothetical protein
MIRLLASKHNVKWAMEQDLCTPYCVPDGSKDGGKIRKEDNSGHGILVYSCILVLSLSSGVLGFKKKSWQPLTGTSTYAFPCRESLRTGPQISLVFYSSSGSIPWDSSPPVTYLECVLCNRLFSFRVDDACLGLNPMWWGSVLIVRLYIHYPTQQHSI